jgi:parallel beta-helix repeat protein
MGEPVARVGGAGVTEPDYIIDNVGGVITVYDYQGNVVHSGADATTEINWAITQCTTGGYVFIKSGTYNLSASIIVPGATVDLLLEGAGWETKLLTGAGAYNAIWLVGIPNEIARVVIRDLYIDGGASAQGGVPTQQNGIMLQNSHDCIVENCYITGMGRTGIYNTQSSNRNLIIGNVCIANWRYGISYTSSSRGRVANNYIKDNHDFGMNWDATMGENSYTVIADNVFENNTGIELYVIGTAQAPPLYGTITGNQFYSLSTTALIKLEYAKNVDIIGNILHNHTYYAGNRHIMLAWASNCVVSSNIFIGNTYYDIELDYGDDNSINDNQFVAVYNTAIFLTGSEADLCSRNSIQDNKFEHSGILVNNVYVVDTVILHNTFYNITAGWVLVDNGTNTKLATIIVPFVDGTAVDDHGWDVDASTEYARAFAMLPPQLTEIKRVRIHAYTSVAEVHAMELDITINGGASNEPYNTEVISVAGKGSSTVNFAANDIIYWEVLAADDADLNDLTGNDSLEIKVVYAPVDGDNCATDAGFRTVEIQYV